MRSVDWIFNEVERRVPPPEKSAETAKVRGEYFRTIRRHIVAALRQVGARATLLREKDPPERKIAPGTLLWASPFAMRRGQFNPKHESLHELVRWKNAQIVVLNRVANIAKREAISVLAPGPQTIGRPEKKYLAAVIYFEIYPDGHKAVVPNWETAKRAVNRQFTLKYHDTVALSTLKRGVKEYGPGQKSGQKRN